jgi:signal transduction histidine kinase
MRSDLRRGGASSRRATIALVLPAHPAELPGALFSRCMEPRELRRALNTGGIAVWLMVGAPIFLGGAMSTPRLAGWAVAYLAFLALFVAAVRTRRLVLVAGQAVCVVALVLLLCDGFEGALLVLGALQLGGRLSRKRGVAWIAVQTALLAGAVSIHWSPRAALLLAPPYLGFQLLAFFVADLLAREARAREELRAAQARLAETSRLEERVRIARELHDAVGHHLTALRLNLEVASRTAEGRAREPVEAAQSISQLLLAEVRAAVAELRDADRLDLESALRALTEEMPRPRIHLAVPASLSVTAGEGALTILRCAQEIVTNAARHAHAENLWLEVRENGGKLELRARDDGRGAAEVRAGNGLQGLRERVERAGGALTVATSPGAGFSVCATLPLPGAAP